MLSTTPQVAQKSIIHVDFADEDARLADKVIESLNRLAQDHEAAITKTKGGDTAEDRKNYLVSADIIILVGTARFLNDKFLVDISLRWSAARHLAGDAYCLFVCAETCYLSELARRLRVVPDDNRSIFATEHGISELVNATLHALKSPHSPRICYDKTTDRPISLELNRLYWWVRLDRRDLSERIEALRAVLDDKHCPRGGQYLSNGRFQLRKRWRSSANIDTWIAYDYHKNSEIMVHTVLASAPALEQARHTLSILHKINRSELIQLIEPLSKSGTYFYFATELIDGISIRDAVLRGLIEWHTAKSMLDGVLSCLILLHERNLFHGHIDATHLLYVQADRQGGRGLLKLVWPIMSHLVGGPAPLHNGIDEMLGIADQRRAAQDIQGWARLLVFCGYGADLQVNTSADKLTDVISATNHSDRLKAFLDKYSTVPTVSHQSVARARREFREIISEARGDLDVEMIEIPGNEASVLEDSNRTQFWMGSEDGDLEAKRQERPRRRVIVSTFFISKFQITQRLYRRIMANNPSYEPQGDDFPANRVTWRDAVNFCNELSEQSGFERPYFFEGDRVCWRRDANGYRLPTEAEWEYAARGPDGLRYPWGNQPITKQACWNGDGNSLGKGFRKGPSPVWSYAEGETRDGVVGMIGNVWEWCWDWFAKYEPTPEILVNPVGPRAQVPLPAVLLLEHPAYPALSPVRPYRILKGGAWSVQDPTWMRAAARSMDDESVRDPDIGFRVVRGTHSLLDETDSVAR